MSVLCELCNNPIEDPDYSDGEICDNCYAEECRKHMPIGLSQRVRPEPGDDPKTELRNWQIGATL